MIFTIGNKEVYEQIFLDQSIPKKLGKTAEYGGGIVFSSITDAQSYIDQIVSRHEYQVYGLDCDMENSYWSETDQFFRLIQSTVLIKLKQ
jgi:hypothetical protein